MGIHFGRKVMSDTPEQVRADRDRYLDALKMALAEMWAENYPKAHELIEDAIRGVEL